MKTTWFAGLSKDDKEKLANYFTNSSFLLDKLKDICYNRILELESAQDSDFDNPNWAFKRAYKDGRVTELRYIIDLLK
jgi:hypothetical protein